MKNQQAKLDWRGDVPVAREFDDPYFSLENGLAETRHVFLDGNDLPARFAPGFRIAELGFGTGLNALASWALWRESGADGSLHFTSFEAFPMAPEAMARALSVYPELADLAAPMVAALATGVTCFEGNGLILEVVVGDARETVPRWANRADAWFLDGFSPAKNPELWEPDLLAAVGARTTEGGTAATYSAAGAVRRALETAGFAVERRPGYGRKRHMVVARR